MIPRTDALALGLDCMFVRVGSVGLKRLNRIIRDNPRAVGPYRAVAAFMRILEN